MKDKIIGIYKITNKINGHMYIGQSTDIQRRWWEHATDAFQPSDNEYDTIFYRAIRKYGWDNFDKEIIEQCTAEKLDEREIYWISYYNTYEDTHHYNATAGGNSPNTRCSKILYQYDLNGNFIKEWKGLRETARQLGCSAGTLGSALSGKRPTAMGFQWRYIYTETIPPYTHKNGRSVELYKNGEFIQNFPSAAACARFLGVTSTTATRAKNNHTKIFNTYEIK